MEGGSYGEMTHLHDVVWDEEAHNVNGRPGCQAWALCCIGLGVQSAKHARKQAREKAEQA